LFMIVLLTSETMHEPRHHASWAEWMRLKPFARTR
jgi:hypothetical protein